jgi:hypothetical protein
MAKRRRARRNQNVASLRTKKNGRDRRKRKSPPGARLEWMLFVDEHADEHPGLSDSVVYALPDRLIASIQIEVPRFFTRKDADFERDLARLSGAGFFLGQPFGHPFLNEREVDPQEIEAERAAQERFQQIDQRIDALQAADMTAQGRTPAEIERWHQQQRRNKAKLGERQVSYLGWLVTNPEFQRNRDDFVAAWRDRIVADPSILQTPISVFGEAPRIAKKHLDFFASWLVFSRAWGLRSLVTWDLPTLLDPRLAIPNLHHLETIADAGIILFIPWYLLRDRDINLYKLMEERLVSDDRRHLRSWLYAKSSKWGHKRYARMFQLYVYMELALKRRYPERVDRQIEALDRAFGRCLSEFPKNTTAVARMSDNVKKIRLYMTRRLRPAE